MQIAELHDLNIHVLWITFFLSLLLGIIIHRTHFCTMGAVSDIVNMSDWTRMRQWGLAIGVAMIGFAILVYVGQIDLSAIVYSSKRWIWLSAVVGGLMFGFGMVIASGCGSKTLVRIGAGSLKSFIVLLVMGVSSFATLKGITAVIRVNTIDLVNLEMESGTSLGELLSSFTNISINLSTLVVGATLGLILIIWALRGIDFIETNNLLAGFGIGGLVVAMWWVTGHMSFVTEHPNTLEPFFTASNSGKAESFSFVAPAAFLLEWLLFFSDQNNVLKIGVVSLLGVVSGSYLHAIFSKTFRWEGFGGIEDIANHLVGGFLMGVGGVTAMGCTVGQGISGISTLNLTSFVALTFIICGGVLGIKYQAWRMDKLT